jgi:hypothetical protein
MKRTLQSALLSLGALVAFAAVPAQAHAQQSADTRWLPWLGCWQPSGETAGTGNLMVCVRPATSAAGVEVATINDGQTVSQHTLIADGQTHELNENGCSGWQRAAFSADGQRAYLRSDLTCSGGVHRTESAIMAMGSPDKWLDVQAVGMDGERVPRVVSYDAAPAASWPDDFALTPQRSMAVAEARVFAAAPLTLADVEEASAQLDRDALVAFLIERDQPFDVDAAQLESLARAGVPDQVIDVVVAVSYPNRFHIDRQAMRMALKPTPQPPKHYAERPYYDPFGWGYSTGCYDDPWACGPYGYGMYGYGMYGFGLGLYSPYNYYGGYGYGGYGGYGPYWYGYTGQPVIIVGGNGQALPQGQAINGRGYTRGGQPVDASGGRTAHPRGSATQSSAGGEESPRSNTGDRRSRPAVTRAPSRPSVPSATPRGYSRPSSGSSSSGSSRTARPRCCGE